MPVYSSIYDGPPNNYGATKTKKKWIVIHNTSNDAPATNEASYAKRRTDSVSSHYYVDNQRIIQSLNTDYRAFHVGSSTGNSGGIAYEITGVNAKSRSWWLGNVRWDLLAAQIRKDCAAHGITPRLLSVSEIKAGKTGIMTHDQARRAWGGTDHTDPGPGFPMDHLLDLVKGAAAPSVPDASGIARPPLREGNEGPEVGRLQSNLNDAINAGLVEDEDFGPATTIAVRELQRRAGITEDGIYGDDSADALRSLLEDDMSWNDEIDLITGQGVSYSGDKWKASFLLASDHYYTLKFGQEIRAEQKAAKLREEAILAAVKGLDTKSVLAKIDAVTAAETARDAALLAEVRELASGGATAQEVYDLLVSKLTGAGE